MTTQHFSEEPPDGTILANSDLTEVINRDDATAKSTGYRPREHWWQAGEDVGPATWAEVSRAERQRLYRQSDVDAAVADAIERTKAGIDAAIMAQMDRLWNNRRLRENGTRCGGLEEAGHIARTWKPEG